MAASLTPPSAPAWEAPPLVLLNTWKHHAGTLRQRIREAAAGGPAALDGLARDLVVVGTVLMDLYLGDLSPRAIGEGVLALLRRDGRLPLAAYRAWIEAGGGYRTVIGDTHLISFPFISCLHKSVCPL